MAEATGGTIWVLAGANGAGKSSIGGAALRMQGIPYFNPDEAARELRAANPGITQHQANAEAWARGKAMLEQTIEERLTLGIETTLGGNTMAALLAEAADRGLEVRLWYVGLSSPALHIARVRARVGKGGHDIPEAMIRQRYINGQLRLIELMPRLTELWVYDNSVEADPDEGIAPEPQLVLHLVQRRITNADDLKHTPEWAKAIVGAALRMARAR